MSEYISLNLTAEVLETSDIIVVGGGPSGTAAAISAARLGKKVILLEQSGVLGGMSTLANVATFMPVGNITGIFKEICSQIVPETLVNPNVGNYAPQFNPLLMRYTLLNMALSEGVCVYLHTRYVSPLLENNRLTGVSAVTRDGIKAFTARVVIDCTGDGRVAIDSGAKYTVGREEDCLTQPVTLMFQMQDTGKKARCVLPDGCCEYYNVNELPQGRILHWEQNKDGTLLVNMTRVKGNGTNPKDINRFEYESLKQVFSVADYLQKNGYENYVLSSVAPQTGVRETNQILGEYTLSSEDVQNGAKFYDVVAQTNYEIDIHSPVGEKHTEEIKIDSYDIPYRTMIPKELKGLLVSGRAISATHIAMSSLRVMPTCFALGQAAGIAASLACENDVELNEININELHKKMKEQGVELDAK